MPRAFLHQHCLGLSESLSFRVNGSGRTVVWFGSQDLNAAPCLPGGLRLRLQLLCSFWLVFVSSSLADQLAGVLASHACPDRREYVFSNCHGGTLYRYGTDEALTPLINVVRPDRPSSTGSKRSV